MKKLFLLGAILLVITGCSSIESSEISSILSDSLNSRVNTTNVNRMGYRYYLPKGLIIKSSKDFNEIISDQKYLYYLYVDIVSYESDIQFTYTVNPDAYYSSSLTYQGKKGYIEINNYENDQYLKLKKNLPSIGDKVIINDTEGKVISIEPLLGKYKVLINGSEIIEFNENDS